MQEDIYEVVPARFETEKLTIQHVRKCCERMPVTSVIVRKCPADAVKRQTAADNWIVINVSSIIVINEIVLEGLPKDQPGQDQQANANPGGLPTPGGLRLFSRLGFRHTCYNEGSDPVRPGSRIAEFVS